MQTRQRTSKPLISLTAWVALAASGCPSSSPVAPPTSAPAASPRPAVSDPSPPELPAAEPFGPKAPIPLRPGDGSSQVNRLEALEIRVGGVPLTVWLADTANSRRIGLMHVKQLKDTQGMLFVYPRADPLSFWMQNTYIPLSLAYIRSSGTIDQILEMEPHTLESHPSRSAVRFVLEVNKGWFSQRKLTRGARVEGITHLTGY